MKKGFYLFLILVQTIQIVLPIKLANAYQIASNHSYVKNSQFVDDFNLNVEGYGDFKAVYGREDNENKEKDSSLKFENEVSVNINIEGELDEITKYGIKFIQTFNNNFKRESEYYSYIFGYYGRLEFGNTLGVGDFMRMGADTIALGSGGISSSFIRYIKLANNNTNVYNPSYILTPGMMSSQNFGYISNDVDFDTWEGDKYLTKLNYYSPEFYGFQLGVSVLPNVTLTPENMGTKTIDGDTIVLNRNVDLGTFMNYGISYINTFDNLGIGLSVVGEENISNTANKKNGVKEDIKDKFRTIEAGGNLSFFGLTVAGSYGQIERKIRSIDYLKDITEKKGSYITYGVAYELDEFSFSVTHFESEYKKYSKFQSTAVALENRMSKNISAYVEYINYESEFLLANSKEKGYSINLGFLLNFN